MTDGEMLAAVAIYYGLAPAIESSTVKVLCPLHADKNPSMRLDFNTGFWYCFGCQEGGKWRKLIRKIENDDLKAQLAISKITKGEKNPIHIKQYIVSPEVARRRQRQFQVEARDFYCGLHKVDWASTCDSDEIAVRQYMINRGFTVKSLDRARAKFNYSRDYKLIFPIIDNGVFKGWICRTTDPEVAKVRKYLYNRGFSRKSTVVGYYGKKSKKSSDYVIVVEGFMDRLKLIQLGIDNTVALFGWKATDKQIEKLKDSGIKFIVSALDNDECGRKGTCHLRKYFDVIQWPYLRGVKDPGDFDEKSFRKMSKKFEQLLLKYERSKKDGTT